MPSTSPSPPRRCNAFLTRLEHMTFAWFTSSMSLGGIANLLLSRIIDSTPLYYLGLGLFCINLVYLLGLVSLQIVRYTCTPASVLYTLKHPIECCFIPTAVLACATVINGTAAIVGDSWEVVLRAAFWIYFTISLLISLVCYTFLFSRAEQSLHHMNPGWVLPIFPLMLCGSIAASVVPTQTESAALTISICGLTCQTLGFLVSCMMYSVLLLRLMTHSYPPPRARPGLFMNCGPPAFTIICLLGLSSEMQRILPALPIPLPTSAYETLTVIALASSVGLWMVSAWFYLLTIGALIDVLLDKRKRGEMEFILAWWASVFPITGWVTATNEIGDVLGSESIQAVAQGMVVWLMVVFVGVAAMHVRAVWTGGIMAEGKDEDRVIDTMHHRFGGSDVEKHPETYQQRAEEDESNPPTYPSTPAVSVRRLNKRLEGDEDVEEIPPLPPSSSRLKMTPIATSEHN